LAAVASTGSALAQAPVVPPPPSVYLQPSDPNYPTDSEMGNQGGVHLDFTFRYLTDYVYRGIDFSETGGREDAPNFQFDTKVEFDFGKAPHPYLGIFANVYNSDPVSRFQEVRPSFGANWEIRPLTLDAGVNTYIYPEREDLNTSEFYVSFQFDDSFWLKTERPVLSPYLYSAYDYEEYLGWYFEAGVEHEIPIEDLGLTFTFFADAAYVVNQQFYTVNSGDYDSGFQHYDVGMNVRYNLNAVTQLPPRYGTWMIEGYLVYTDGIEDDLLADSQLWGGAGLRFRY
jgi:hypothetical protein